MEIRPIRTEIELADIHGEANANGHRLAWPSHVITKDKYVIGSLSIMPSVHIWMHAERAKVRDTLQMKDFVEGYMANSSRVFNVVCDPSSPLLAVLEKPELGYIFAGKTNLFLKGV